MARTWKRRPNVGAAKGGGRTANGSAATARRRAIGDAAGEVCAALRRARQRGPGVGATGFACAESNIRRPWHGCRRRLAAAANDSAPRTASGPRARSAAGLRQGLRTRRRARNRRAGARAGAANTCAADAAPRLLRRTNCRGGGRTRRRCGNPTGSVPNEDQAITAAGGDASPRRRELATQRQLLLAAGLEEQPPRPQVPELQGVVLADGDQLLASRVKVGATNGTCVRLVVLQQPPRPQVPELDVAVSAARRDTRGVRVEADLVHRAFEVDEGHDRSLLLHIPDAHCLVLTAGGD
mmetsp:Transcript_10483/g.29831  ORF Transcript_10483/g.29831 Transcript_10483/m.29831 type:complete len:296 (+) Transcript_10483:221-1108(+)